MGGALLAAFRFGAVAIAGTPGAAGASAFPVAGAKGDALLKAGDMGCPGDAGPSGSATAFEFPGSGFPKFC